MPASPDVCNAWTAYLAQTLFVVCCHVHIGRALPKMVRAFAMRHGLYPVACTPPSTSCSHGEEVNPRMTTLRFLVRGYHLERPVCDYQEKRQRLPIGVVNCLGTIYSPWLAFSFFLPFQIDTHRRYPDRSLRLHSSL